MRFPLQSEICNNQAERAAPQIQTPSHEGHSKTWGYIFSPLGSFLIPEKLQLWNVEIRSTQLSLLHFAMGKRCDASQLNPEASKALLLRVWSNTEVTQSERQNSFTTKSFTPDDPISFPFPFKKCLESAAASFFDKQPHNILSHVRWTSQ